jgi:hypothetical protein
MILKIWKKGKFKCEKIWKIWKISELVIITPKETSSSPCLPLPPPPAFLFLLPPPPIILLPPSPPIILLLLLPLCIYIHCFSELRRIILE